MAVQKIEKKGYGQLELHKVSSQYTKEIYAQLPADKKMNVIEQGMALIADQVNQVATPVEAAGQGYVCLVSNEIHLPDPNKQGEENFALFNVATNKYQVEMKAYPKLLALTVGDTFTTNTVKVTSSHTENGSVEVGTKFVADTDGYWKEFEEETESQCQVVLQVLKDWTMPDGQRGFKFVVAKADPTNVCAKGE